jgi:heterodisulfide reductase subunit A
MEKLKIGVYVCDCGINIAGTVNVGEVVRFAQELPNVTVAREYKYQCSDPGQGMIKDDIRKLELNRVVVASCTPRMHEVTFQNAVAEAGLNPYYFAMAHSRHVSWVVKDITATKKANGGSIHCRARGAKAASPAGPVTPPHSSWAAASPNIKPADVS